MRDWFVVFAMAAFLIALGLTGCKKEEAKKDAQGKSAKKKGVGKKEKVRQGGEGANEAAFTEVPAEGAKQDTEEGARPTSGDGDVEKVVEEGPGVKAEGPAETETPAVEEAGSPAVEPVVTGDDPEKTGVEGGETAEAVPAEGGETAEGPEPLPEEGGTTDEYVPTAEAAEGSTIVESGEPEGGGAAGVEGGEAIAFDAAGEEGSEEGAEPGEEGDLVEEGASEEGAAEEEPKHLGEEFVNSAVMRINDVVDQMEYYAGPEAPVKVVKFLAEVLAVNATLVLLGWSYDEEMYVVLADTASFEGYSASVGARLYMEGKLIPRSWSLADLGGKIDLSSDLLTDFGYVLEVVAIEKPGENE